MSTNSISSNSGFLGSTSNEPVRGGIKSVGGVVKEQAEAVLQKAEEIKAKGLSVWNFLKRAGVMAGTSIGAATIAGCFSTTIANYLVGFVGLSLPILGIIAGCLFAGGVIATIVYNVKDPDVHGAGEVFCNSLRDIFKNIGLGLLELLTSGGSNIKTYLNIVKQYGKDFEQDISDLKTIADNATKEVTSGVRDKINELENSLIEFKETSQKENKSSQDIETLKRSRKNITDLTSQLLDIKEVENIVVPGSSKKLPQILRSIQKNIKSRELDRSLQELEESFSKNENSRVSQNKCSKFLDLDTSQINMNQEIGENTSFFSAEDNQLLNETNQIKQQKISGGDLDSKLKDFSVAFVNTNLDTIKAKAGQKVQSCDKQEAAQYNNILKNITILKVFNAAVEDLKFNLKNRNIHELGNVKNNALSAIKDLQQDKFVQDTRVNLDSLKKAIEALGIDSNQIGSKYNMSVEIGKYKSWYFLGYDYERSINCSLNFNGQVIGLALT